MRKLIFLLTLCAVGNVHGQDYDHVVFDYDVAGNQIKRYLIDIDRPSSENPKNAAEVTPADLIKSDIYDDIKYYPNPVKEELYVFWDLINDNNVQSIQLYTINGKLVKSFDKLSKLNSYTLPFQTLPEGIYSVTMVFKNGEKKSLKVIKNGS